ncbi:MAG TPA: hypothetical protein DDZ41_07005, partial [Flavobacterium sp.]|nr:hypothetical protein [Flavobacterium sp.]
MLNQIYKNLYLNIIHQNIRSLRKNFDFLLANLLKLKVFPEIICLSETHIYDYETSLYSINGYTHLSNCNNDYKCGGVSLFVKCNIINSYSCLNTLNADFLCVDINWNGKLFFIVCVYRLHSGTINGFISDLCLILENNKNKK